MLRLTGRLAALAVASLAVACSSSHEPGTQSSSTTSSSTTGAGPGGSGGAGATSGSTGGAPGSGGTTGTGGSPADAGTGGAPGSGGAGTGGGTPCSVDGVAGECLEVAVCAGMTGYSSTPGYCPGPADIECCTMGPSVADNPPTPAGYQLMTQAEVTPAMTAWAVMILDDPTDYPMFSTAMMTFGTVMVLARVEWHPPDFQNAVVHRGVTLYEPI